MKIAVVGGGIIGLAAADLLVRTPKSTQVAVFEKEASVALHQTGRNSGVLHTGIYYEPGSLKARLCLRGAELMREFCLEHELPFVECGKVVVASREEDLPRLDALLDRAQANGVPGIRLIGVHELRAIEPNTRGVAALYSPTTAILDYAIVAHTLARRVARSGGRVVPGARVARIYPGARSSFVRLANGEIERFDHILVCAGLQADQLARATGEARDPQIVPFRGEFWKLRDTSVGIVRGLVYPAPDPSLPFLGVHFTPRVDGSIWIGPNAAFALSREGYRRSDFSRADVWDALSWQGTRRLFARHWRAGSAELARSVSKRAFVKEAQRLVPSLTASDVEPAPSGVRAQAVAADGSLVHDFVLESSGSVTWVRNAPSPAATSSFAIAEELVGRIMG